jgi:hypothetical protein
MTKSHIITLAIGGIIIFGGAFSRFTTPAVPYETQSQCSKDAAAYVARQTKDWGDSPSFMTRIVEYENNYSAAKQGCYILFKVTTDMTSHNRENGYSLTVDRNESLVDLGTNRQVGGLYLKSHSWNLGKIYEHEQDSGCDVAGENLTIVPDEAHWKPNSARCDMAKWEKRLKPYLHN